MTAKFDGTNEELRKSPGFLLSLVSLLSFQDIFVHTYSTCIEYLINEKHCVRVFEHTNSYMIV